MTRTRERNNEPQIRASIRDVALSVSPPQLQTWLKQSFRRCISGIDMPYESVCEIPAFTTLVDTMRPNFNDYYEMIVNHNQTTSTEEDKELMDVALAVGTIANMVGESRNFSQVQRLEALIRNVAMKMVVVFGHRDDFDEFKPATNPIRAFAVVVARHLIDTTTDRMIRKWIEGLAVVQFDPLDEWICQSEGLPSDEISSFVTEVETVAGFGGSRVLPP